MIILAFNFFIHITSLSIFVFILKFGIIGVGVATSITYTMNFILVTLYAELQSNENLKPSWKFDLTIIQCAPEYLKYGFASWFALFLFWWPFELTVLYGGWFDLRQSAGSTILNSFTILLTNVPYGIALTASSFVGYSLGANLPNKVKKSTFSAYIIGFFTSLSVCFIVVVFKYEIMSIYTNDRLLIELIDNSMLEYILMLLACLFNWSVNGVLNLKLI